MGDGGRGGFKGVRRIRGGGGPWGREIYGDGEDMGKINIWGWGGHGGEKYMGMGRTRGRELYGDAEDMGERNTGMGGDMEGVEVKGRMDMGEEGEGKREEGEGEGEVHGEFFE